MTGRRCWAEPFGLPAGSSSCIIVEVPPISVVFPVIHLDHDHRLEVLVVKETPRIEPPLHPQPACFD